MRLDAQEGAVANAWLTVTPSRGLGTTIPDTDFRSVYRYWLRLPLIQDGVHSLCLLCGELCDPFVDHFVNCHKNGLTTRKRCLVGIARGLRIYYCLGGIAAGTFELIVPFPTH